MVEPFGIDRIADHDREIRVIKRMIMDLEERFRASPGGGGDVREQAQLRQDVEAVKQLVDQISSREGVTLHRLETLKERVDGMASLAADVEELKKQPAPLREGSAPGADPPLAGLQEGVREVRQHLELLRAGQAAQAKRLDALKEENMKLRSEFRQLESRAHEALEALRQRGGQVEERLAHMERERPAVPAALPRRPPAVRSNLGALRERAARVADIGNSPDPEAEPPDSRGGKGRARPSADGE